MSVYQCDGCDNDFPGSAPGSSFVVRGGTGKTNHFCSSACLRAWTNDQPAPTNPVPIVVLVMTATIVIHAILAFMFTP